MANGVTKKMGLGELTVDKAIFFRRGWAELVTSFFCKNKMRVVIGDDFFFCEGKLVAFLSAPLSFFSLVLLKDQLSYLFEEKGIIKCWHWW